METVGGKTSDTDYGQKVSNIDDRSSQMPGTSGGKTSQMLGTGGVKTSDPDCGQEVSNIDDASTQMAGTSG